MHARFLRLFALGCALVVVAGCSASSDSSSSPSVVPSSVPASVPSSSPAAAASSPSFDGTVLEIAVSGSKVEPKPSRHTVKAGSKVRLVLTTDKANVVHVHGADVERDVTAGRPLTLDFTIDDPGVYPIELHEPELLLAQVVVR